MKIERTSGTGSIKIKTTTGNVPIAIDTIALIHDTSVLIIVEISARRTDAVYSGGFVFIGQFTNDDNVVSQIGSTSYTFRNRQQIPLLPKWNAYFEVNGTDVLIFVKGNNGHTVEWKSHTLKVDR